MLKCLVIITYMLILDTILEFIFPVNCVSCKTKGAYICSKCLSLSPEAERETEKWIFPIYDYRHPPIKKSIWFLKYKGKTSLAKVFADALYSRILEEVAEKMLMENFNNPILIPIPLSSRRLRERGFNQAEIICDEIMKIDRNQNLTLIKNVLKRKEDKFHQAKIKDRKQRLENIIDCFKIDNPESIKGRNIVIIDDVTTTGATLKEARKVLREAGTKKIIAFTIAH
ncbi:MAG: competence protein ComFC [Patescibacteria group bacterium]|nr:competence protein ComFC [Patescibacteria group bacterium]